MQIILSCKFENYQHYIYQSKLHYQTLRFCVDHTLCVFFTEAEKRIVFYDICDLTKVVMVHPVGPDEPGRLCTSTFSFLLYEDQSQKPRQLKWLDCSKMYPTVPKGGLSMTCTRHASLIDFCCAQHPIPAAGHNSTWLSRS